MIARQLLFVLCPAALLAACGEPSDGATVATSSAAVTTTIAATTTAAPTTAAPTTNVVATTTTEPVTTPPATEPTTTATPVIGQCPTSVLALSLGEPSGAMGSTYTPLVFTNNGSITCTLDGHPGVSFVDGAGNQVGPSVERTDATTPTVALAPGEQAHATLQTHNAGLFGDACAPVSAGRMKVYPPDQTEAILIDYPFDVCTGVISEQQFFIDVVKPGTAG